MKAWETNGLYLSNSRYVTYIIYVIGLTLALWGVDLWLLGIGKIPFKSVVAYFILKTKQNKKTKQGNLLSFEF